MVKDGDGDPALVTIRAGTARSFGQRSKQVEGLTDRALPRVLPLGERHDAVRAEVGVYLSLITLNGAMQRLFVLPPGAPQAAVDALRAALLRLGRTRSSRRTRMKTMGYVPEYDAGPDTNDTCAARWS